MSLYFCRRLFSVIQVLSPSLSKMVKPEMSLFATIILSSLCFFVSGCSKDKDGDISFSQADPPPSSPPAVVEIPEPDIGVEGSRFKLTELSTLDEKVFRLNDNITFTGLSEQMKAQSFLKDVQLKIKLHCTFDDKTVFIKEFRRILSQQIPLIELLSSEVLLPLEDKYPACGFSFSAEHKGGAAHYFELPHLPIVDYTDQRFIRLLTSSGELEKVFPYVFMDNITDYHIDTGTEESIDSLNLMCSDFSLSLKVRYQQFIPFSVFPFETLTEEQKQQITNEQPTQQCRIFGYRNNVLVGISSVFHLAYPAPPLRVDIERKLFKNKEDTLYSSVMKIGERRARRNRPDIPLYTYSISNPHPYPVHILIDNYKKKRLKLSLYGLYHMDRRSFYRRERELFDLGHINTVKGQAIQTNIKEEGTLIRMEPKSRISFSSMLTEDFSFCDNISRNGVITHWLGAVVQYPDLKIYQLTSDKIRPVLLSQNIRHELDTQSGEHFKILTKYLTAKANRRLLGDTFFRRGTCSGKIDPRSTDPTIKFRSGGRRLKFINFTPVPQYKYHKTDLGIAKIINNQ